MGVYLFEVFSSCRQRRDSRESSLQTRQRANIPRLAPDSGRPEPSPACHPGGAYRVHILVGEYMAQRSGCWSCVDVQPTGELLDVLFFFTRASWMGRGRKVGARCITAREIRRGSTKEDPSPHEKDLAHARISDSTFGFHANPIGTATNPISAIQLLNLLEALLRHEHLPPNAKKTAASALVRSVELF